MQNLKVKSIVQNLTEKEESVEFTGRAEKMYHIQKTEGLFLNHVAKTGHATVQMGSQLKSNCKLINKNT